MVYVMGAAKCELAVKYILPAFRSLIARNLIYKYNLSQVEAARLLGITQAAVSYYLSEKRGKKIRYFENLKEMQELTSSVADRLERGEMSYEEVMAEFCALCKKITGHKPEWIKTC
jgi:hypothetical protein